MENNIKIIAFKMIFLDFIKTHNKELLRGIKVIDINDVEYDLAATKHEISGNIAKYISADKRFEIYDIIKAKINNDSAFNEVKNLFEDEIGIQIFG